MTIDTPQGFTLIELLVVIAIVAILATIATPSFVDMNKNSRLNGAAREFVSIIQLARSEAISRNSIVNLYNTGTADDWSLNIHLCEAANATTTCVSNTDDFINAYSIGDLTNDGTNNNDVDINSSGAEFISFNASGRLNGSTGITLAFCDKRTDGNRDFQLLAISATGRPSVSDLGGGACDQ